MNLILPVVRADARWCVSIGVGVNVERHASLVQAGAWWIMTAFVPFFALSISVYTGDMAATLRTPIDLSTL